MYSTEKNPGINWKDLIIKAIFLVVFLLLLVWLFPSVPNMKPFYSNVFRENIKYMQDAAESYYTTERLPKNIGDSAEMTLQEMINKNLILPFVDEDGNECDTYSSYVQVRKNKNDYTLKVNLVCPKESNYVEKTLGCYEYCETCKEELEYQFKKETTSNKTTYSCPDGGVLSGTTCYLYKTNSYKATETTSKGEYYCPNGGELNGTTCYVSKTSSYNASTASGKYYCPFGGSLSGTTCYVDDSYTVAASTSYSCPNGGSLSGTTCYVSSGSNSTVNARITSYTCPDGTTQSTPACITPGKSQTVNASIKSYTCPNGKVQSSSTCTTTGAPTTIDATPSTKKKTYSGTYLASEKPSGATCSTSKQNVCSSASRCPGYVTVYTSCYKYETTYNCPVGYTKSGSKCTKAGSTTTTTGKPNYYCPNGVQSGNKCIISGSASSTTGKPNYYCPNGVLSGSKCVISAKTTTYSASISRTCPSGTRQSGNSCIAGSSYTYTASRSNDEKYCPKGGTLSGDKCIIDDSYTYKASLTTGKTVLTCPNGGELKDKSCYTTSVSNSYAAKASVKKVTSYSYKWSTEESLAGWTKTGESRVSAASMAARN